MASRGKRFNPNMRRCWDYDFLWTPHHLTADQMEPLRHQMDSLASDCVEPLNALAAAAAAEKSGNFHISDASEKQPSGGKPDLLRTDMYALLRDNHGDNEVLQALWEQVNTIPDWVDWEQIDRGQRVYYRYGQPMTIALAFQSLLGGMGAGKIVETLSRTGGFSAKVVRHRLLETFQHTLQISQSLDSIRPGGPGHVSTVRVRLLHAAVRNRILKLSSKRLAYYDVEKNGIPINDLDCIGTICSFAPTVIWIGLPRQGIYLSEQEAADYIALWRLVAWYIGTPNEWFESPERARGIMESILVSEVHPTRMSGVLARNIIIGLEKTPPLYASRGVLEAMTRQLIGTKLANALGIGHPSPFAWAFAAWVFLYGLLWSVICRTMPLVDSKHIESSRAQFWKVLMDVKTGLGKESNFDFKYIPQDEKKYE